MPATIATISPVDMAVASPAARYDHKAYQAQYRATHQAQAQAYREAHREQKRAYDRGQKQLSGAAKRRLYGGKKDA